MKTLFRTPLTAEEKSLHTSKASCSSPSVYCGTYGKYNDGDLSGAWVDIDSFDTYEEFIDFCYRLHANESDPEFMMQDFEYYPESWYSESGMSEETFDRIKAFASLDEDRREAYETYLDHINSEATIEDFEEHFCGEWDSPEAFAEDLYRQCYEIPEYLEYFIDWAAVWRNLDTGGDYTEVNDYIFSRY